VVLQTNLAGPVPLVFQWKDARFYEIGVTRQFDSGLRASAGYLYVENSVPTATFNPAVPDADRNFYTAGLGGVFGTFSWDLAYQYTRGSRTVVGSPASPTGETGDGHYRLRAHAIAVTVGSRF
jgi:long-chain fatty acid transport protein